LGKVTRGRGAKIHKRGKETRDAPELLRKGREKTKKKRKKPQPKQQLEKGGRKIWWRVAPTGLGGSSGKKKRRVPEIKEGGMQTNGGRKN